MSRPALRPSNSNYQRPKMKPGVPAVAKKGALPAFGLHDRVAVRMDAKTLCSGDVRYVGPSGGRMVVGIRLDDDRPGLGDGKRASGERTNRERAAGRPAARGYDVILCMPPVMAIWWRATTVRCTRHTIVAVLEITECLVSGTMHHHRQH